MEDPDARGEMERTSKSIGTSAAAKKIIDLMMVLLKKKERGSRVHGIKDSKGTKMNRISTST
jgi:hypothetical protein